MSKGIRWLARNIAAPGPYLTLCLDEQEYRAVLRKLKVTRAEPWPAADALAAVHCLVNKNGDLAAVVCLREPETRPPIDVAVSLVHEAVHIWQMYAEHIGETNPGREQEAYAIEAISHTLMTEYARRLEAK